MDGFSGNEKLRDGQLVTSRGLKGIWKILPKNPQSVFYPWLENPTGRELGGMRIEQVEPKKTHFKKKIRQPGESH